MTPTTVIQETVKAFKELEAVLKQKGASKWPDPKWTKAVLTALCLLGHKLKCTVGASPKSVSCKNRDWGEWLFDAIWCSCDGDGRIKAVKLVAESEWGDLGAIEDDFQKLLVARATVRVMVFDAGQSEGGTSAIVEALCGHVQTFQGQKGDTYLLIAYVKDEDSWRFDYSLIEAGQPGAPPTCRQLK